MARTNTLQAPRSVVMIRPHKFYPNGETAADNAYQKASSDDPAIIADYALQEFDGAVATLRDRRVEVHVFDDDGSRDTPDSVFPNNWFSTHPGGQVALCPMFAKNRRRERRYDVIEFLKAQYRVQDVIDYSGLEPDGLALEGTGAMVLDHIARVALVVRSHLADPIALERFCTHFAYEPVVFSAVDPKGQDIYHTNVLMCVGTDFALIGTSLITNPVRRAEIVERLEETGRIVIDLAPEQILAFVGNAIELTGKDGRILALSRTALNSLTEDQKARITPGAASVALDVPTIELAGGSARCMIAGVHIARRGETV